MQKVPKCEQTKQTRKKKQISIQLIQILWIYKYKYMNHMGWVDEDQLDFDIDAGQKKEKYIHRRTLSIILQYANSWRFFLFFFFWKSQLHT